MLCNVMIWYRMACHVRMYVCTYMHLYCITEVLIIVCILICRGDGEAPHEAWWTATGEAGAHNSGAAVCLPVSAWVSSVSISFVSFDITRCKFYGFGLQILSLAVRTFSRHRPSFRPWPKWSLTSLLRQLRLLLPQLPPLPPRCLFRDSAIQNDMESEKSGHQSDSTWRFE